MLERLWSFAAHQQVHALVTERDECFVACRSSRLVALDALSGQLRWEAGVANSWGWLALSSSRVVYLNQHSRIDAFDRRTGDLCWTRELDGINGWLHAADGALVVGGWRGYTDVLGLDVDDGTTRWTHPARGTRIHSTRVHRESRTLLVATGEDEGRFVFVDLATGKVVDSISVPGAWVECCSEHPTGSLGGEPLVMDCDAGSFFLVEGTTPSVRRVALPEAAWSRNLRHVDGVVPYVSPTGELVACSLTDGGLWRLGAVRHGRADLLPFAKLAADAFVYGTSFGLLGKTSTARGQSVPQRVGKRVSTQLINVDGVIVFGTAGGEVLGYKCTEGNSISTLDRD